MKKKSILTLFVFIAIMSTFFLGSCKTSTEYINRYEVVFDSNGGSEVEKQIVNEDGKITKPTQPTKTGYVFDYWCYGTSMFKFDTKIKSCITLTAKWTPKKYNLTYVSNDDDFTPYTVYQTFGEQLSFPHISVDNGYEAVWKYKNGEKAGTIIRENDVFNSDNDETIEAFIQEKTYSITYELNNGSIATDNSCKQYTISSNSIDLSQTIPTKRNYTFDGWYNNDNFEGDQITTIPTGSYGDCTLYAKYTPLEYPILYVTSYGELCENYTTSINVETTTLDLPTTTNADLRIVGWYDNQNFEGLPITSASSITITQNFTSKTLYAKYEYVNFTADYYFISSAFTLKFISDNSNLWDKSFVQIADIDCANIRGLMPIGTHSTPFTGKYIANLNGTTYKITNLQYQKRSYYSPSQDSTGLFGCALNATFKDVYIDNLNVSFSADKESIGGFIGKATDCIIDNCNIINANIGGSFSTTLTGIGGIIGEMEGGEITNSSYSGKISISLSSGALENNTNNYHLGGLVAFANISNSSCPLITNCYTDAWLDCPTAGTSTNTYIGGLVGALYNGYLVNCYSLTTAENSEYRAVIPHSLSNITSKMWVGGLVGFAGENKIISTSVISNCYSMAKMNGDTNIVAASAVYLGGLVGGCYRLDLSNSYYLGNMENKYISDTSTNASLCCNTPTQTNYYLNRGCGFNYLSYDSSTSANMSIPTIIERINNNWTSNVWDFKTNNLPKIKSNITTDIFEIDSIDDFVALQGKVNIGKYKLMNNLDFTETPLNSIPAIVGEFDGNGYTLSNIRLVDTSNFICSLFNYAKAYIHDLKIDSISITSGTSLSYLIASSIVGISSDCILDNCSIQNVTIGNIKSTMNSHKYISAFIGCALATLKVNNCNVKTITINSSYADNNYAPSPALFIGGLAGFITASSNCLIEKTSIDNLSLTITDERSNVNKPITMYVGGFIGKLTGESFNEKAIPNLKNNYIKNSSITINHNDSSVSTMNVGGFIGNAGICDISYSFSDVDITCSGNDINSTSYISGFIGILDLFYNIDEANISNSYCTGSFTVNSITNETDNNHCSPFLSHYPYLTPIINTDNCYYYVTFLVNEQPLTDNYNKAINFNDDDIWLLTTGYCSAKHIRKLIEEKINVKYCDSDVFSVALDNNGATTDIENETPALITDFNATSFDTMSSLYSTFMQNYTIPTQTPETSSQWNVLSGSTEYTNYSSFSNRAKNIYNNSNSSISKNISYNINNTIIFGINKQFIITCNNENSPSYSDMQTVVSRLFGYSDKNTFTQYAQNLANAYLENSAGASVNTLAERLKYKGAIYTSNGSIILPYVFRNEMLNTTVLTYIILDSSGVMSIWINDISSAFKTANVIETNYNPSISSTITDIDVFGNCILFETACDWNINIWKEPNEDHPEFQQ